MRYEVESKSVSLPINSVLLFDKLPSKTLAKEAKRSVLPQQEDSDGRTPQIPKAAIYTWLLPDQESLLASLPWLIRPLGSGGSWPPQRVCHRPDGERRVSGVPPVLRRADVHAPQLPAVPVGRVLIPLHLEGVLFDVVNRWEDHSLPVLLDSGENRLSPETQRSRNVEIKSLS